MDDVFSPARRYERFSVVLSVVCGADGPRLADQVVNLSAGGACVKTHVPLAPGTKHQFQITVPDAKLRPNVCLVEAKVAWVADHTMGLTFAQKHQCIDDYLRRLERASHSI